MGLNDIIDEENRDNSLDNMEINDFIIGIIAGESCFGFSLIKSDGAKYGYETSFYFSINMRKEDEDIIRYMAKTVGAGTVRYDKSSEQYHWRANSNNDCRNIIRLIESLDNDHPFLMTHKYETYCCWRDAVLIATSNRSLSKEDMVTVANMVSDLNRDRTDKYQDIIKDIEQHNTPKRILSDSFSRKP